MMVLGLSVGARRADAAAAKHAKSKRRFAIAIAAALLLVCKWPFLLPPAPQGVAHARAQQSPGSRYMINH